VINKKVDETYTTAASKEILRQLEKSRKIREDRELKDIISSILILQIFLDRLK
jgi:RNase H-fold protein (predicted Holliday junction resolvase)